MIKVVHKTSLIFMQTQSRYFRDYIMPMQWTLENYEEVGE